LNFNINGTGSALPNVNNQTFMSRIKIRAFDVANRLNNITVKLDLIYSLLVPVLEQQ
jgi:hypothetical protein